MRSYRQTLFAWLQKHQRYPRRLKRRGIEGEVSLFFSIDRQGRLLESRITQSSGHEGLDKAALDLLREASPMPALPNTILNDVFEVSVPIRYSVR